MKGKLTRWISVILAAALLIPSGWLVTPVANAEEVVVYHETFEDGQGAAAQSGDAKLTVVDKAFEGNSNDAALYVENRTKDYDAVDFAFDKIGLENGKSYEVTVSVYVDEDVEVPANAQAFLQTVSSYGWLAGVDYAAGSAITLKAKLTVDTEKDSALRVQSNAAGAGVPFYIGDIKIVDLTPKEEPKEIVVYNETFESGLGVATEAGAKLTAVTGVDFDGNEDGAAVHVTERSAGWNGTDIPFSSVGMENGKTYTITIQGYVADDVDVPDGAQALVQNVDTYNGLYLQADLTAGQSFTLKGTHTVDTTANEDGKSDRALRIQSNDAGATVPFYIGDILITTTASPGVEEPEEERPPAKEFTPITFEDEQLGGFVGRQGAEVLTVTTEANHTENGEFALKVENRSNTWHGPSLNVAEYVDKGHEYKISAWVKLIEPASSQLQLSTQVGSGDGASYNNLQGKTITVEDGWVKLEGTYRYTSVGNENLTIYVESSNNTTASFYIDDISFEPTGTGVVDIERDLAPLKDVYEDYFLIGNAISGNELEGTRLELLKMHHNLVSAENAMKPSYAYDEEGNFDFTAEDQLVEKAAAEGFNIHGHVLVWHQQSREALHTDENGNPLSRDEALANLKTHVQTVVEHFGDSVISWDVVNEAMNDNPPNPEDWKSSLRQSGWLKAIGPDYLEHAYRYAKEVIDANEWDIKLYYNDYNDDNQNKASAIYHMVKEINEKYADENDGELLIDGIGMQAHYNLNTNPENVRNSMEKFISLGVEVGVTELDITAGSNNELTDKQAQQQAYLYAQLFKLYKEKAEHISRVTIWGLNDATSWRAAQSPLLFDKDLKAKPAYYAIIDPEKFIEEYEPDEIIAKQSTALYGTPTIDGQVDDIWNEAVELTIDQAQQAWQVATGKAKVLWDENNLYVLVQVNDSALDKSNADPNSKHEQDSVEVFLDQKNGKATFYQDGDGQYRINFDNEASFNVKGSTDGFESKTKVEGTSYTVELKIPFTEIEPKDKTKIGFDVQINDAKDGKRDGVTSWNDQTGRGYADPSVFGILTLVTDDSTPEPSPSPSTSPEPSPSPSTSPEPSPSPSTSPEPSPSPSTSPKPTPRPGSGSGSNSDSDANTPVDPKDDNAITPELKTENSQVIGKITAEQLSNALAKATADANGKQQIIIDLSKQADATAYEVQLPAQSLQDQSQAVFTIKTEYATVTLPSGALLSAAGEAEQISIRVASSSIEQMNEAARDKVGNRPVVNVSLLADNQTVATINGSSAVTIAIPYTPSADELLNPDSLVVWHIDKNGDTTAIANGRYDAATGTVVFQTSELGNFAVAYVDNVFEDTAVVPWAQQAIDAMSARDIITGVSASSYAPQDAMNRADFIALLVRALELKAEEDNHTVMFEDVEESANYYNELAIARALGIASGYSDNSFKPEDKVSRQDMMVLTARALAAAGKSLKTSDSLDQFSDSEYVASYAQAQAAALIDAGIINGKNGKIAPDDSLTRAEAAVILYRIWKL